MNLLVCLSIEVDSEIKDQKEGSGNGPHLVRHAF